MATPVKAMNGEQLLVQIGDGGSPETFVHDCLINTDRGIQFQSNTTDSLVPFCDEPESPGWLERSKDGLNATISGAGMLHTTSVKDWFLWYKSDDTKTVRVRVNVTGANGGGWWQGEFLLTEFQVTGQRKEKATVSVTLLSSGEVTWTDAP